MVVFKNGRVAFRLMKSKQKKYVLSLLFVILLYVVLYFVYIYPLSRLQILQTKEWATTIITNTVLGATDKSHLYKIQKSKIDNLSFYYNYFFFHTEKCTIFICFNLHNQYSNTMTLNVYLYNFETKTTELNQTVLDFNDLRTYQQGDTLHITCGDSYIQHLNMISNEMTIEINISSVHLSFDLMMDDYTTNMPTFLPRYDNIKSIHRPYFPITSTTGEWCTDNPMIGKIIKGTIHHETIENGHFWHDNFLGVNDYFLPSYAWHIILNDNWLIYKLWFGEYEKVKKNCCFIVKHRKTNTVIRAGFDGNVMPLPFKMMDDIVNPVDCKYTTNKPMGTLNYDSFQSHFQTNELSVKFESIPNECHRVFLYDYYDSGNKIDNPTFEIVNNCKFVEYVAMINVEIVYNGETEVFQERCVIDAMFKADKNVPDSF
jgi:hypothetical protein